MSGKPKKQDYKATESEKASASVAMADYNFFKAQYDPILREMRDRSLSEDTSSTLRARSNADTMQALTSQPTYAQTQQLGRAGEQAQALQGQLGVANASAKDIQNKMQTGVLGVARGQAADAQTGMAKASRLATSTALDRAQNNQAVRSARLKAAGKIAGTAFGVANEKDLFGTGKFGKTMGALGEGIDEMAKRNSQGFA